MTLLLVGCATGSTLKHKVLTPPPSAPRASFVVEKPDVQSRETGDDAWRRNRDYGVLVAESLRAALRDKGKTIVPPPADTIRAKVYLAYGPPPVKVKDRRRRKPYVEIRLQLADADSGTVRYSTHTQAPIEASGFSLFGDAPDSDAIIRDVLEKSVRDFVSRL